MDPSYRILSTGDLEIATMGTWRLVAGCSCRGIFEYQDRMTELQELIQEAAPDSTVESLYLDDRRFRYLCDRVLTLNGLEPEQVRPRDLGWLLFGWMAEDGTPQPAPLALLNTPPEPRHPRKPSANDGPGDFISLVAAIASQGGSLEEAIAVATSKPARLVLGALEDRAWGSLSAEEKDDVTFKDWAKAEQTKAMAGIDLQGWAA